MDREEIRRNQAQESVSVTEEVNEANPIDSTQEINPTIPSYVIDDTTFSDSFDEEFLVSIEEEKQRLNSVIAGLQEKEMARHEQERREREAWLEKLRRENGLLSSDEEEQRIQNVYVFIFNQDGTRVFGQFYKGNTSPHCLH